MGRLIRRLFPRPPARRLRSAACHGLVVVDEAQCVVLSVPRSRCVKDAYPGVIVSGSSGCGALGPVR
ncbi:hypothetical protein LK07_04040 [Streptomyces pluripotens]|uniref:Uncharacterized protein n=1 Tax=Streptomyces pluripotens TaxID=1355015 RepID=A0A221NU33_9ACTN|nr:hypothetical protein LK06_002955 [Streptomyces pluripotens]ASN23336.1 hypothetical protein LK07_04040 [Streptomyces pluripotens]KIE25609.1 hypothetical protein LK08_17960 [Streptomyces sp. MUSC 125]